ncbi:hypothetical protein AVEN_166509-1 [Araneus ventricosus]|uniref:Uncharacterized protein n=1 Tax=Araneus ventricosus TaxID=182803 RepID=A0A4Y2SFB7_ARAVE|nr:hypothetical protein AVEN_166509-1 [Araneus ventricosus]
MHLQWYFMLSQFVMMPVTYDVLRLRVAFDGVEGLMPLHIKAKMQSTLVRVGRLGRNCDYEGIHFDHQSYEQPSPPSTIHPALFSLEDRITHGG